MVEITFIQNLKKKSYISEYDENIQKIFQG